MCVAADYGNAGLLELLIQKGADVNVSNSALKVIPQKFSVLRGVAYKRRQQAVFQLYMNSKTCLERPHFFLDASWLLMTGGSTKLEMSVCPCT